MKKAKGGIATSIFDLFKRIESSAPRDPIGRLIVCLGNPGKEYALTRHNAGFLFAEYYAAKQGFTISRARFEGLTGEAVVNGERVLFLCPTTYMNDSGISVRKAADFYKIPPERILVICDDVNLAVGKMRIRRKGSDGGQRGLRSIIYHLNTDQFPRMRIGVGAKPEGYDLRDWVLGKLTTEDQTVLKGVFDRCADALNDLVKDDFDAAMSKYN